MNRTILTVFTLTLLLSITYLNGLSFLVKATGTIFIRADGSVDPETAQISTINNITYTFTGNISDEIVVERDNIVVDGEGYTVQGTGSGTGIYLSGRSNVTIKNMEIRRFRSGIHLDDSSNNTISANNVTNNEYGIVLYWSSSNNTLRHNAASHNRYNLGVHTALISGYIQDIDDSNTVNSKPVYYWVNKRDMTVPLDAGYVVLVNCTRITVQNLSLTNNMQGVALALTTNSIITRNNITNNYDGIRLDCSSNNNMITGNNITATTHYGIRFYYNPSTNTMSRNNVANNEFVSQLDGPSNNNIISRNRITNNEDGIRLDHSSNNTISANNVTNNTYGIGIYHSSGRNIISGNNIIDNYVGIWLYASYGNEFFHNNFIDNFLQVYPSGYNNFWDDGYPSGGNYWNDYDGVDVYGGENQDVFGGDGIGDSISINNDRYPLVSPWPCHDVATVNITATVIVGLGVLLPINVTVSNQGDFTEVFNVTLYGDGISVGTQTMFSARGALFLTFFWNMSGVRVGTFRISAWTSVVQGEVDLFDNGFDCLIEVIPDLDGDGFVGIQDIVLLAGAYGSSEGDPNWNPYADMAPYFGKIDIFDIVTCAYYYGRTW